MRRYGKKLNRGYDDKLARSNRGRARTSATAEDREHANRGYRRGQVQITEIRASKKRSRLVAWLTIEDDLFDLELAKRDPEIWLHGTDLTTFEDTVTRHRYYPSSFAVDPYAYVPDTYDWDWEEDYDRVDDFRYLHTGDYDANDYDFDLNSGWDPDPDPAPIEAAWCNLWVAGLVHDPEGRDQPDSTYDRWYRYDLDYDLYDYLDDLENPLLEREDPAPPATIEAIEERNNERHRAGERYYKQTGRTVLKRLGAEMRSAKSSISKQDAP